MIPSAVPIRKLPFLLNFYDVHPQFAFCRTKELRLMRVLIIFMLLCSALSLPRKKNTKTLLIETMDKKADDQVSTSLQILIRPSFRAFCVSSIRQWNMGPTMEAPRTKKKLALVITMSWNLRRLPIPIKAIVGGSPQVTGEWREEGCLLPNIEKICCTVSFWYRNRFCIWILHTCYI